MARPAPNRSFPDRQQTGFYVAKEEARARSRAGERKAGIIVTRNGNRAGELSDLGDQLIPGANRRTQENRAAAQGNNIGHLQICPGQPGIKQHLLV